MVQLSFFAVGAVARMAYARTRRTAPAGGRKYGRSRRKSTYRASGTRSLGRQIATPAARQREVKCVDTYQGAEPILTSTGFVGLINSSAAGTDIFNHIGRKTNTKSIQLIGQFWTAETAVAASSCVFRCLVVYDRETNGATPDFNLILQDNSASPASAYVLPYAPLNLNNRSRFKVLYDKIFHVNIPQQEGIAGDTHPVISYKSVKKYIKVPQMYSETIFSGTASGVGSIVNGAYWLVINQGEASPSNGNFKMLTRWRFFDS